jgi:hypothetical protein
LIAIDTNVLVYAHRRESIHHCAAARLLRTLAEGDAPWAIPWPVCSEYLSVVTNSRFWGRESIDRDAAWAQLKAWARSPSVSLLAETDEFLTVFEEIARRPRVNGRTVHDARIAALCMVWGAEVLLTCDRDFSLFPELRTRDPFHPD